MKRLIALALTLLMLLPLCACASQENPTQTADLLTEETEEEKKTFVDPWLNPSDKEEDGNKESGSNNYHKADQFLPDQFKTLPIADSSMTTDQLRQLCVDFFKLAESFQWIPDRDMKLGKDGDKYRSFEEGKLYGGIPYINTASGNLYRILEYYDPETGILDCSYFAENAKYFGNACSGGAGWAWARVINSVDITYTHSMNASHGFIPVGPYKYDHSFDIVWTKDSEGNRVILYSWDDVCKENGEQVMFESYAMALPADCFSNYGHVRMATEKPVVVRNPDGTIDGEKSYVKQADQGLVNEDPHYHRTTSDGTKYQNRGKDGMPISFNDLFAKGYVPHTFPEFLGTDPVEKGEVKVNTTETTITPQALSECVLEANYPISDVFTVIRDADGNQVGGTFVKRTTNHFTRKLDMVDATLPVAYLKPHAEKGYTIEVRVQIGTGEVLTAYTGTLIK